MSTAPAVVTAEDEAKARTVIAGIQRIETLLTQTLVTIGVGCLIFTAVNVTLFAIKHHTHWAIAWMLDPLVSLSLLATLYIDGKLAAYGYRPGGWPFVLRWFAGLATWLMNCWGSLYPGGRFTGWPDHADPAGLVLHSVLPFLVIVLAEAGAGWRKFTTRKKADQLAVVEQWKAQREAARRAETEERKRRENAERATAEAERKRTADLAAEEKRAAIERAKARESAAAEAERIRAGAEAEARLAEQARLDAEARHRRQIEDTRAAESADEAKARREAAAREHQARLDREAADQKAELQRQQTLADAEAEALRKRADGEAEAARLKADADARAADEARKERHAAKESRRTRTAETTAETAPSTTAVPRKRTAVPTAETAARPTAETRKLTAVPTAELGDVRGADAKRKQIEEANFEAAILILRDEAPTRKDFGLRYGRSETWGRDRYAEAERLMDDDASFADRVVAEVDRRSAAAVPA